MSDLSEVEIHAFNEALDDECRAWATYDQVVADFGDASAVRQHSAEARHIEALRSLFGRDRLPVPGYPWGPETVARYASLQEAREGGGSPRLPTAECMIGC